ncbi:mechanosensitive ion channel [Pseudomonas sp. 10B1]|uniref:mechanosensitive ion channel family protein n=1 Tax=unclassified Pseudomonas TaxID=196821 RepID=UPI002B23AE71|nr:MULTISPECIES: mechanosensitive ion channel domain-containing protein [unclassified Pseudomonas]MEA9993598.1 mechanosensitive ion channel [Pseudomonas sp. AA4]MEB0087097.1 mechanosensitive ion channel [Pseudomonas sp. RTI1]MEB0126129.1 mechanosensitive ion channel [Pseudomonas sp. CCC1.2]MEB0153380.1 mechanosensitive ion channel [Pseudomonas sp. CCC4.3]MEB0218873.1 mechanosensitive ion channel [Pseudomonas sp. AB12(2023)]
MLKFKTISLICILFCAGIFNVQAAELPGFVLDAVGIATPATAADAATTAPAAPAAPKTAPATPAAAIPVPVAPVAIPAKPEILVQGGLLGAISSSIDNVQNNIDLDNNLIDAWRLRADRAADEIDVLVNQRTSRSKVSIAGDFLVLSAVWMGAFVMLLLTGRFFTARLNQHRFLATRYRPQALLSYLLAYTLPAVISLPLTLYVSHFLQASVGRALALCFAYATSSGIVSTSVILCVIVMFNAGHKRVAVRIIRQYSPRPLFLIGFLAALSDALTSPQISRQLGSNITSSIAVFTGLFASVVFCMLVIKLRRPVAHLIRDRSLAGRLRQPALQESLNIFSSVWYLPILLMILVSAIHLIGAGQDSQKALRCALLTTVLLISTVFLSTVFQHLFKPLQTNDRNDHVYKTRLLSLLHAVLRIALAVTFIEVLARIWGFSLLEFAQGNTVGRAISDSLSRIGLIFLVTWLLWVILDTAIQEALKPPMNKRSSHQPSTRIKTILPLLRNAIKIILLVICAITTMANLGINVAPLLAGAGVVGLAIGFGSQQLVQDVITGLFIIIEDTISIGDWVVLDSGHSGTVESLTIRTLRLRDGKGFVHSVPFGQIKAVTNQSRQFAYAFFAVQFTYDTDIDSAMALIREAGSSISDDLLLSSNLQGPLEVFGLDRMDLNGVVLTAQFRTVSGGQYGVSRAFNERLKKLVDKTPNVHFAQTYPQMVMSPQREPGVEEQPALAKPTVTNGDGSESPAPTV